MSFRLFDPDEDVRIGYGAALPHWYQPGATYFVTFRTADSIPQDVARLWQRRRDDWLLRHGINVERAQWQVQLRKLPEQQQREFHATFSREFMEHLDYGYGACELARPEIADMVSNSLLHFDGERYTMGDFVVMPNHVHLLVCLEGEIEIEDQCRSWKKYTATQINRELGRRVSSGRSRFRSPRAFTEQFEIFDGTFTRPDPRRTQTRPVCAAQYEELPSITKSSRVTP